MLTRTKHYGRIIVASIVITFAAPMISNADATGHDWFCSDPDAHAQYEKHRKLHHDHNAEEIATALEKIYDNSSLTQEQKHAKTVKVIDTHLAKAKTGNGVGD